MQPLTPAMKEARVNRQLRDFRAASNLDEAAQRELLKSQDAVERIWAIWALGLRASEDARSLATHLDVEPEPGVRRALAVVLAGQGQVDLLVALSQHDPDVYVRASAAQLIARFAAAGRIPWSVVRKHLSDESEVREAVLSQIGPEAPSDLHAAALECLADGAASVRLEAFEMALRLHADGQVPGAILRDWLNQASRDDVDAALVRWLRLEPQKAIVNALADASQVVREQAIRRVPSRALADVLPLLVSDLGLFERLMYEFNFALADAPTTMIVQLASRPGSPVWYLAEVERRLSVLDHVAPELSALLPALRCDCDDRIRSLDEVLASPEALAEYEDEEDGTYDTLVAERALACRVREYATHLPGSMEGHRGMRRR